MKRLPIGILGSGKGSNCRAIFEHIRLGDLAAVRPAVYVKGGDYTSETLDEEERSTLKEIEAAIRLIPFETGYSTSGLIEQICKSRRGKTK